MIFCQVCFAGRIIKRRPCLKGASVASASPASAWAPVGGETLASLITRHAESTKAADMFARKSAPPNYSGTSTSSKYRLTRDGRDCPYRTGSSAATSPCFTIPSRHGYLDRRARHGAAYAIPLARASDRLVRLLREGPGFFDGCTLLFLIKEWAMARERRRRSVRCSGKASLITAPLLNKRKDRRVSVSKEEIMSVPSEPIVPPPAPPIGNPEPERDPEGDSAA